MSFVLCQTLKWIHQYTHFMYLQTESFTSYFVAECVTSLSCEVRRWFPDAALMSDWGGLWFMYVSRTERGGWGGREGGGQVWDHWSRLKHESWRPTLPISCLHFISILLSVIPALLKHPMKASPQIHVCASLFFMGLKWGTLSASPPPPPTYTPPPQPPNPHSCVCFEMPQEKLWPLVYITVPLRRARDF